MLRERRRHANFKPNRRLDRKSSRGMIYENEELRLRTININAEVERGQNDIRKLRRENEQLKREIWNLRDEYDKLHQFLNTNRNSCENLGDKISNSGSQSEDSCDTCQEIDSANEKFIKDNYYYSGTITTTTTTTTNPTTNVSSSNESSSNLMIGNSPIPIRKQRSILPMIAPVITIGANSTTTATVTEAAALQEIDNSILQSNIDLYSAIYSSENVEQQKKFLLQLPQQSQQLQLTTFQQPQKYQQYHSQHHHHQQQQQQQQQYQQQNIDNDIHHFDHLSIVSEENLTNSDGSNVSIHHHDPTDNYDENKQQQQSINSNSNNQLLNTTNLIRGTTLPQLISTTTTTPLHQLSPLRDNIDLNFYTITTSPTTTKLQNIKTTNAGIISGMEEESITNSITTTTITAVTTVISSDTTTTTTITTHIPPLSHFENICDEKFGLTVDTNCVKFKGDLSPGINTDQQLSSDNNNNNNNNNNKSSNDNKLEIKSPRHFFSPIATTKLNSEIVAIKTLPPHKPNLVLPKNFQIINSSSLSSSSSSSPPPPLTTSVQSHSLLSSSSLPAFLQQSSSSSQQLLRPQIPPSSMFSVLPSSSSSSSLSQHPSASSSAISQLINTGPPDICVANVLGGSHNNNNNNDNILQINAVSKCDDNLFQNGGNLEELLFDIQNLSSPNVRINDNLHQQQQKTLKTFIGNRNNNNNNNKDEILGNNYNNQDQQHEQQQQQYDTNKILPYHRSEINLVLNYNKINGINTIKTNDNNNDINDNLKNNNNNNNNNEDNNDNKNDHQNDDNINFGDVSSGTETLPKPMILLPPQLPYLGFENIMLPSILPPPIESITTTTACSIPLLINQNSTISSDKVFQQQQQNQSTEQIMLKKERCPTPTPRNISTTAVTSTISTKNIPKELSNRNNLENNSKLSETNYESSSGSDKSSIRKIRRVSILNSYDNSNNSDKKRLIYNMKKELLQDRGGDEIDFSQSEDNLIAMNKKLESNQNFSSSTNDLYRVAENFNKNIQQEQKFQQQLYDPINSIIFNNELQQQVHSTPNSPHSVGKRLNKHNHQQQNIIKRGSNSSHHYNQINRKLSNESSRSTSGISLVTATGAGTVAAGGNISTNGDINASASSLDNDGAGTTLTTIQSSSSSHEQQNKSKVSRRHSEGTIISGGQQHRHHNHHRHHHHHNHSNLHNQQQNQQQHQNIINRVAGYYLNHKNSSVSISNYGGGANDSHHDLISGVNRIGISGIGNIGGGISTSERNSNNSLASSHESSVSINLNATRRKMSNVSHNGGGKIPWCGCWGNGCL